jgi:hypothetical protein
LQFLWNLTNPLEVAEGAKPHLEKVGPWTYLENRFKFDHEYAENGNVVKYKVNKTYSYVDMPCKEANLPFTAMCSMPEDMIISTLNIPLIGVVNQVKALFPNNLALEQTVLAILQGLIPADRDQGLFITKTMNEIVFGYDDGLLGVINALINAAKWVGIDLDLHVPATYEILKNVRYAFSTEIYIQGCHWFPTPARLKRACM